VTRRFLLAATLALASGRLSAQQHMHDGAPPSTGWSLAYDGRLNAMYNHQSTQRGDNEPALLDWEMLMASRAAGAGRIMLSAMTSLEPLTLGGDGYAELLQTGGTYRHAYLHDRQHPNSALMELSARYDAGAFGLYVAAVGDPGAGPTWYAHRASAARDPFAPLGHHWQDATHSSAGVISARLTAGFARLEGSIFNAREPDEGHLVVDYRGAQLDSYSGRLTLAAPANVQIMGWWAYLGSHDRLDPDTRMHRYGASVSHDAMLDSTRHWATTAIWGMNLHHHTGASHAVLHGGPNASPHHHASSLLLESNFDVTRAWSVFGRAEQVMKNGEELGFLGGDLTEQYRIRVLSGGVTRTVIRYVRLGARGAVNFIPEELRATYGTQTPIGFAIFLQLSP
jgi:hypothetical protein